MFALFLASIQQRSSQGHDDLFCGFDNRELTSYKGEPDPFKGDVPNQRVRDMAKEALDAMFAATDPSYSVSSQQPSFAVCPGFAVRQDRHIDGVSSRMQSDSDAAYVADVVPNSPGLPRSCKQMAKVYLESLRMQVHAVYCCFPFFFFQ